MLRSRLIQVYEHSRINVGDKFDYNGDKVEFTAIHLKSLAAYLTVNENCGYYNLLFNGVRFNQYVGVIQVDGLTIEVLPKTDKHNLDKGQWQKVLIDMLRISLHVEAKTTTVAATNINKLNVLDAYLLLFLEEVESLMHGGLVKKYRKIQSNQNALKGRLLFGKNISKNLVHAERFYVEHTTYDHNNLYNAILYKALNTISGLSVSNTIRSKCNTQLLDFPECDDFRVSNTLFDRLKYDRKTNVYRKAIELARIILMNFHPDFKGGKNNILAIMVDMNELWENYIYFVLRKASHDFGVFVYSQQWENFWKPDNGYYRTIRPDIVIEDKANDKSVVLDTKWKYQSKPSVEDVRQMYAYGHYFEAYETYLVYPDQLDSNKVSLTGGVFAKPDVVSITNQACGLMKVDLISNGELNKNIGEIILQSIVKQPA